jgi:hypothetical protein
MSNPQSIEEIAKAAGVISAKRVIHYFTVPARLQAEVGAKRVGFVELTGREQNLASRRGGLDPIAIASELAKESLRRLDDQALSTADGSADSVWEKLHPKLRTLCTTAYATLHSPTDDEASGFLRSREIEVR